MSRLDRSLTKKMQLRNPGRHPILDWLGSPARFCPGFEYWFLGYSRTGLSSWFQCFILNQQAWPNFKTIEILFIFTYLMRKGICHGSLTPQCCFFSLIYPCKSFVHCFGATTPLHLSEITLIEDMQNFWTVQTVKLFCLLLNHIIKISSKRKMCYSHN